MNSDGTPDWTVIDKYHDNDTAYFVCLVEDLLYELKFSWCDRDLYEIGDLCIKPDGDHWPFYYRVEQKLIYQKIQ